MPSIFIGKCWAWKHLWDLIQLNDNHTFSTDNASARWACRAQSSNQLQGHIPWSSCVSHIPRLPDPSEKGVSKFWTLRQHSFRAQGCASCLLRTVAGEKNCWEVSDFTARQVFKSSSYIQVKSHPLGMFPVPPVLVVDFYSTLSKVEKFVPWLFSEIWSKVPLGSISPSGAGAEGKPRSSSTSCCDR